MDPPSPWKTPNQVMQLHKLKMRKKALQERMRQPSTSKYEATSQQKPSIDLNFSRILNDKRKNPFSKNTEQNKKSKQDVSPLIDESNDKTLFAILKMPGKITEKLPQEVDTGKLATFSNLLQKFTAEHAVVTQVPEKKYKHLTIDWALKTKLRLMSTKPFPWTSKLKASEEASGITGFVRCLDTSSSPTVDTSPRARFHQVCLYWQHPHLPWINLFPRSSKRDAAVNFLANNEEIKEALFTDWTESFRSLFQLVRALHCPYFYVCANTFTCVFRAAGVGGAEPSALLAPTTTGLRNALRQEDIEFTMPLRPDNKKKFNNSNEDQAREGKNSSIDSCYDTMDDLKEEKASCSGDDEDSDQFLSQMGLPDEEIRRINRAQWRAAASAEGAVDSAAESLVAVRGADAQALFCFLLNWRGTSGSTAGGAAGGTAGGAAGLPPTLLAPTAFHGAALHSLKMRENIIQSESGKFYSVELRGPLLPSRLHAVLAAARLQAAAAAAPYSAVLAHHAPSRAFTAAARQLAEEEIAKEKDAGDFGQAFNKENLSDCGISKDVLDLFCSMDPNNMQTLDSVKYNPEDNTYTW